jgi:hypothetical protein
MKLLAQITLAILLAFAGATAINAADLAPSAGPQPPLEFKGVPLGSTTQLLQEHLPGLRCSPTNCWMRPSVLEFCPVDPRNVRKDQSECVARFREVTGFGPAAVERWDISIDAERVMRVEITIGLARFIDVLDALAAKYGRAHSDQVETVSNKLGVKVENRIVEWQLADGAIRVEQRGAGVDHALVSMTSPAFRAPKPPPGPGRL